MCWTWVCLVVLGRLLFFLFRLHHLFLLRLLPTSYLVLLVLLLLLLGLLELILSLVVGVVLGVQLAVRSPLQLKGEWELQRREGGGG